MLDKEKGIDAVVVGTPDHNHAIVSVTAMKHGKHVYCEKPLTRTVKEARIVAQVARETKRVTQMGNQGMAFEGNRLIKEWIWGGVIGPCARSMSGRTANASWQDAALVAAGIERPRHPACSRHAELGPLARSRAVAPVPSRLRAVQMARLVGFRHGRARRHGHPQPRAGVLALKLGAPTSVTATSTPVFKETVPVAAAVHYEFPARDDMPAVKLHWYDGGLLPERPEELEDDRALDPEDGIIFVGDKGKILVEGWGGEKPRLIPAAKQKAFTRRRDAAAVRRPLPGIRASVQAGHTDGIGLRFLRSVDRSGAAGERRHSPGGELIARSSAGTARI